MVPIRVYSKTLTLITEIDTYQNLYYTSSLYSAGAFELTINFNIFDDLGTRYADYLLSGYFIQIGNDFSKIGKILETERKEGPAGKGDEVLIVRGAQAKIVLGQRIIYPPAASANYIAEGVSETTIKNLLIAQIGTGAATARKLNYCSIVATAGRGTSYLLSARYQNLLEKCNEYCQQAGVGLKFTLNPTTGKLDIDTIHGLNRTFGQSTNPKVIFSSDFDTLKTSTWKNSTIPYKSTAIIGGAGIGAARNIREIGGATADFDRHETFVDARECSTSALCDSKGTAALAGMAVTNFLDGQVLTYSQYVLGTDYNLGDIVTVQMYGTSFDVRICDVKESWEAGVYDIALTFGSKYPELPSVIAAQNGRTTNALNNSES